MPTNREIVFVLKMRNQARQALRQFGADARASSRDLTGLADNARRVSREARAAGTSIATVATSARRAGTDARASFQTISQSALSAQSSARGIATALAGVSVAAASVQGIRLFADFDRQVSVFHAVAQASTQDMARVREEARRLGAETEFSAGQAAEALTVFARAGYSVDQSIKAAGSALDLAMVGQTDLASAAQITMGVLNQFGISAERTADVVDILSKVDNIAAVTISDMGESFQYAGTVANSAGLSLNALAAAIGVLGDAGTRGSNAGTELQNVISRMLNVTPAAARELRAMGLSIRDLDPTNFVTTLEKLGEAGINAQQALRIFDEQGGRSVLTLVQNTAKLREYEAATRNAAGAAREAARTIGENLVGDWRQLSSAVEESAIAIGDAGFGQALRLILQRVATAVREFSAWVKQIKLTSEQISHLSTAITTTGGAIAALGLAATIGALARIASAAWAAAAGFVALAAAVNAVPLVRLVTLLGTAGAAAYALGTKLQEVMGAPLKFGEFGNLEEATAELAHFREELAKVDAQISDTSAREPGAKSAACSGILLGQIKLIEEGLAAVREKSKGTIGALDTTYSDFEARRAQALSALKGLGDTNIPANVPIGGPRSDVTEADAAAAAHFNEALRERIIGLQDEARMIGLSMQERERLTGQLEIEAAARQAGIGNVEKQVAAYLKEYDVLQRLKDAFQANPLNGLQAGFATFAEDASKLADKVADAWNGLLNNIGDNLAELVATGKASWGDMVQDFGKQLLSAGFKNILANLFSGPGITAGGGGILGSILALFGTGHQGALIGHQVASHRRASPAVFSDAMRFHSGGRLGLKPDEVPFIGLKGERVLNREQTRDYERAGRVGGLHSVSPRSSMMSGQSERRGGPINMGGIRVSVETKGSSGDATKDRANADMVGRHVAQALDQKLTEWVTDQQRPGGLLWQR